MNTARLRVLVLVVGVFLLGSLAPVQAQGAFAHGTVVALQGTPHLWFADEHGVLHWGGDTRALAGKHIAWSNRVEVSLDQLRTLPVGDPWLSAGLLKDGDPIYLVKWETEWPLPQLLHIQSIGDVELFGINGSNYGNFVIDRPAWEARYGISAAGLQRGVLAAATAPPPVSADLSTTETANLWVYLRTEGTYLTVLAWPAFDVPTFKLDVFVDEEEFCNSSKIYGDEESPRELSCGFLKRNHQQVRGVSAQTHLGDLRCAKHEDSTADMSTWACAWRK